MTCPLTAGAVLLSLAALVTDAAGQPEVGPPPRLRPDAGPPLPAGALARLGRPRLWHPGSAINVAFAPSGTTLVSTGNPFPGGPAADRLVILWDARTGEMVRQLRGHTNGVQAVAFSPDGKRLATGGMDRTVRVWEVDNPGPPRVLAGHTDTVLAVAFSPDGKRLASEAQDATVRVWDVDAGKQQKQFAGHKSQGTSNVRFSPDGRVLATVGADFAVHLRDPDTGADVKTLTGPTKDCESLDFSPDGTRLAAVSEDGRLWVWDVATGKKVFDVAAHPGMAVCVRYSPDGAVLATGGTDGPIRFWQATTGKPVRSAAGHPGNVSELSFSRDGTTLASAGHDGSVRLWDAATGKELPQSGGGPVSVALSPDGAVLATADRDRVVRFRDPVTGTEAFPELVLPRPVVSLAFAGARTLVTADATGEVTFWDAAKGQRRRIANWDGGPGVRLATNPHSRFVLAAGANSPRVWDRTTETPAVPVAAPGFVPPFTPLVLPDDARVTVGCGDGRVRVWDVAGRTVTATLPGAPAGATLPTVTALACSSDGRTLAVAQGRTLRVLEVAGGADRLPPWVLPGVGWSVAVSPGGSVLAVGTADGRLIIVDVRVRVAAATRQAHRGPVSDLAFTPDGRFLVSASGDRFVPGAGGSGATHGGDETVLVWDVAALTKGVGPDPKPTPAEAEALAAALARSDASAAYTAVCRLAAAPDLALPLLRDRLPKAAGTADAVRVAKLLADLDDDAFDVREKATRDLIALGPAAARAVRDAAAATTSREVKRRAEEVLARLGTAATADVLLQVRGVEALERMGTADARAVLEPWAKGPPDAVLTREAAASLRRLKPAR